MSVREVRTNGLSYLQPGVWGRLTATQEYVRKEDSKPKVYLIETGTKRWITSPAVLFAMGKTWADVRSVPDGALSGLPDGPDVATLSVSVTPHPVPLNQAVTVTVSAISSATGADVGGQVLVNGTNVGTTGMPFQHTFRTRRIRVPDSVPLEFDIVFPTGIVRATGFPDTPIDLGF